MNNNINNKNTGMTKENPTKIPGFMVYGILLICIVPYLLTLLGVDFGSTSLVVDHHWAADAKNHQMIDAQFQALSGAFTHTLLEWTAFCVAVFVVFLALSHYKITNDITTPVIGVAFFMAGCMDAFHTLAADRLINAVADNRDLIPFTWAISRTFNALIMIAGVSILLMRNRNEQKQDFNFVITVSIIFGIIAYVIIATAANTSNLPKTTFPESLLSRPYDALPLVLFIIAGLFVYPRFYKRYPSLFAHGLMLSAIPEIMTQLHMTFGSKALFDSHFNIGHFLKIVAYGVPLLGLTLDYIRAHSNLQAEINERKEAEAALKDKEAQQRTILNTVADSIITINEKGIIQTFNHCAERTFGYSCDEVIGQNVSILLPDKDQKSHNQYLSNSSLKKSRIIDLNHDLFGRRSDGSEFPLAVSLAPMDSGGCGTVGILRDITQQKASDQALRQFKTTLDQTLDCVFMFNPETLRFFYVNAGAIEQVGYSEQELLAMTPVDIKPEYNEVSFRTLIEPMIQGSRELISFETSHLHKDGHMVPVEIFLQYIHPLSELPRFVAMVRDISERQRIDRMKDQFVSTVSHELRTPLTSIRGSLGLITGGAVGELPEQACAMLKIAENNTRRLLVLINDILDIQKIETGEVDFEFNKLMLMPFLEKAIEENAAFGEQYGVHYKIIGTLADAELLTDKNRLMQIMTNLLSNAAKFSNDGGDVDIDITRHKSAIRIAVRDYGMGIAEEFKPKLYDRFTQSDAADTRKVGGTGLGLSICKVTVEKLGGTISFESSEGIGTTFYIDLPQSTNTDGSVSSRTLDKNLTSVLIIEDEPDTALIIRQVLLADGLQTDIAYTPDQARKFISDNPQKYQAITLDLLLDGQESMSFLKELRNRQETRHLPAVVVSVKANDTRHENISQTLGVVDWIQKPIDHRHLLSAVRKAVGLRHLPKVLHVEGDPDVRQVVALLLRDHAQVTAAMTVVEAKMQLQESTFNLVLLDLDMPDCTGEVLIREMVRYVTPPKIVIFSAKDIDRKTTQQVNAVLLKSATGNSELLQAVIELLHDEQGFKQGIL